MKRYKTCTVYFRASKQIEIPIGADPHKRLIEMIQLDAADGVSDLRYEGDFVLGDVKEECKGCGDYRCFCDEETEDDHAFEMHREERRAS